DRVRGRGIDRARAGQAHRRDAITDGARAVERHHGPTQISAKPAWFGDELLEVALHRRAGRRDPIQDVPERLDLEDVAERCDAATQILADGPGAQDGEVAAALRPERVGDPAAD